MSSDKPRVFLSSTIHDFRDLRSALKLWLEEYGYEVLASEMNDFRQLPDLNSFHSCLEAIKSADTFILFIGNRVGGWYDEDIRISITRKEFQVAYDSLKQGTLHRLLVFVRQEIWDIREDRKELKRFLAKDNALTMELSEADAAELVNHPSKFVTDAAATFEFIKEVARIDEMKEAQKGTTAFPIGNWIYRFTSFKDIVDGCKTVLNLSGNVRRKAMMANLSYELEQNLLELLQPWPEGIEPVAHWASQARTCVIGGVEHDSMYKGQYLVWLGFFMMSAGNVGKRLKSVALQEAITSGEFLEYEKASGAHVVGALQQALLELEKQVARLRFLDTSDMADEALRLLRTYKPHYNAQVPAKNAELATAFALSDVVENTVDLSVAIHHILDGTWSDVARLSSVISNLRPSSPFPDENEKMTKERVTHHDVVEWIESQE